MHNLLYKAFTEVDDFTEVESNKHCKAKQRIEKGSMCEVWLQEMPNATCVSGVASLGFPVDGKAQPERCLDVNEA